MSRLLILLVIALGPGFVTARSTNQKAAQPNEPNPGEVRKVEISDKVFMEFCWIPAGEAQLGASKEEQDYITNTFYDEKRPEWLNNETEAKRGKFKTKGFWLGKYTVTQEEWKAVMGGNPSVFAATGKYADYRDKVKGLSTLRFPVENVSWNDCQSFLSYVKSRTEAAGRALGMAGKFVLPHEDEWEYACRGGKGNGRAFFWGSELNGTQANCDGLYPYGTTTKGQYLGRTCAVDFTDGGKYEKHPWGLHHMHGNVWQYCGNIDEGKRILRGGSWFNFSRFCRASYRHWTYAPEFPLDKGGFRVCFCPE